MCADAGTISRLSFVPGPDGSARAIVSFSGPIPPYRVGGDGSDSITLVFARTARSDALRDTINAQVGVLSKVSYSTTPGGDLVITLQLSHMARATTSIRDATLYIDLLPLPLSLGGHPSRVIDTRPSADYEIVPLRYADVSEIAGILVQGANVPTTDTFSISGSPFALPTSVSAGAQAQNAPAFPASSITSPNGQRISDSVAIDRRLNAVILSGSASEIAGYKALIAGLDVPQRCVVLEAQIVELSQTSAADLGLDPTGGSSQIASASGTYSSGALPQFTAHLQAAIYATINSGGGKLLASPRIVALEGVPAQILTGDALPIITTTTFPGPPLTTQQTVTYISVGVNLQIQSRITDDGDVTAHVFAEVSSVSAYVSTQQGSVPQISLRQASTVATVHDGEPFVIGGLLLEQEIRNLQKLPGVGDLPLLGGLLRTRHDNGTRTNLYIVITPHLTGPMKNRPPADLLKPVMLGPIPNR